MIHVWGRLNDLPAASTADDALSQLNRTLERVEDELSGVPRDPKPTLSTNDGRMYTVQPDNVVRNADGSLTATTRGNVIDAGADGSIQVRTKTGDVVHTPGSG